MKIELIPNPKKDRGFKVTKKVLSILLKYDCDIFLPQIKGIAFNSKVKESSPELVSDIIIVLGGDGSIMRAAKRASVNKTPLLGINLGRVGFLAEINTDELELLSCIMSGDFTIEKRMMLEVKYPIKDALGSSSTALNDVVLSHGRVPKIVDTELFCNGSSLGKYRSDGFVISTPTGSTAYSLSAGGPIIDPALKGICLVPVCSHSLTARPMVVPDTSLIEIKYLSSNGLEASLAVDGVHKTDLYKNDVVTIIRSPLTADFIKVGKNSDRNFYKILRDKMSES